MNVTPMRSIKKEHHIVLPQRYHNGDKVEYKKGLLKFKGTITKTIERNNQQYYNITMDNSGREHPTIHYNCNGEGITMLQPSATIDYDSEINDEFSTHTMEQNNEDYNPRKTPWNHDLGDNKYQCPPNTKPKKIQAPQILKYSKDWSITISTKDDLKKMYNRLQSHLGYYNIPLLPWDELQRDKDIISLLPQNCTNYTNIRHTISSTIYDYFDTHQDTLFNKYSTPKYTLKAFENKNDGLCFLKHMLTAIHPHLRDITDYERMTKPKFKLCQDIHDFITKYLEWLCEEKMLNNRKYTDKENIDYILDELDSRFDTA
jgi:hypothetical protein